VQREPFERGLRKLGWTLGSSLRIEYRYAEGEVDRLPALAAELVRLPVDVIVARGGAAVRAARQATSTIPIVMSATADPVRQCAAREAPQKSLRLLLQRDDAAPRQSLPGSADVGEAMHARHL
jgi:ABC-type uncharacterized transport system substrate-binding protein